MSPASPIFIDNGGTWRVSGSHRLLPTTTLADLIREPSLPSLCGTHTPIPTFPRRGEGAKASAL
ncbi:MAG: hypothetical protein DHS20C03_35160 [Minwuia thermotolerans]|nr:MAG: hypothetical protein DHS20C03_35160 [Minwuia thermotolerans]